jgi:hypothetical protein
MRLSLKKFMSEQLFFFFLDACYRTDINTLNADTLKKAWKKHLKLRNLIGAIWEEESLQLITGLNDTTTSFLSHTRRGNSCNIFTRAKEVGFQSNGTTEPPLHKDIIEIILKIQQAIILTKLLPTRLTSPLQQQPPPVKTTNNNDKHSNSPSATQRQLPSLLTPALLEDSLHLTQTQENLFNAQTGAPIL